MHCYTEASILAWLIWATVQGQKLSDLIKENIVSEVFTRDPALAASAIRLSFHDCVGDDGNEIPCYSNKCGQMLHECNFHSHNL